MALLLVSKVGRAAGFASMVAISGLGSLKGKEGINLVCATQLKFRIPPWNKWNDKCANLVDDNTTKDAWMNPDMDCNKVPCCQFEHLCYGTGGNNQRGRCFRASNRNEGKTECDKQKNRLSAELNAADPDETTGTCDLLRGHDLKERYYILSDDQRSWCYAKREPAAVIKIKGVVGDVGSDYNVWYQHKLGYDDNNVQIANARDIFSKCAEFWVSQNQNQLQNDWMTFVGDVDTVGEFRLPRDDQPFVLRHSPNIDTAGADAVQLAMGSDLAKYDGRTAANTITGSKLLPREDLVRRGMLICQKFFIDTNRDISTSTVAERGCVGASFVPVPTSRSRSPITAISENNSAQRVGNLVRGIMNGKVTDAIELTLTNDSENPVKNIQPTGSG